MFRAKDKPDQDMVTGKTIKTAVASAAFAVLFIFTADSCSCSKDRFPKRLTEEQTDAAFDLTGLYSTGNMHEGMAASRTVRMIDAMYHDLKDSMHHDGRIIDEALEHYLKRKDSAAVSALYFAKGRRMQNCLNMIKANDCYEMSFRYMNGSTKPAYRVAAKLSLAETDKFFKNFSLERKEFESAVDIAEGSGDSSLISMTCLKYGRRLKEMKQYVYAIDRFDHALEFTPAHDSMSRAELMAEKGTVYAILSDWKKASACAEKAYGLSSGKNTRYRKLYECMVSYTSGSDSVIASFNRLAEEYPVEKRMLAYRFAAEIARKRSLDKAYVSFLEKHVALRDSIDDNIKEEMTEKLQYMHEYRLQKRNIMENKKKITRNMFTIYRLAGLILVIIGISGFMHYRQMRKRKDMKILLLNAEKDYMNLYLKYKEAENDFRKEKEDRKKIEDSAIQRKADYFRRLNQMSLPVIMHNENGNGAIHLKDKDWKTIRDNTDACFDSFTERLRRNYPQLTEEDINFCCLIKMELSITMLSEIYHIAKGSISRRKMRLKEKMGLENITLDEFISSL